MPLVRRRWLVPAAILAFGVAHAAEVTIYRCTDAQGRLTLRDTPCAKGQQQQTREMLRPRDPPRAPAAAPATTTTTTTAPVAAPAPRVIVVHPPQPLYECITPDGDAYTSDTSAGDPRWVPLWTLGYPLHVAAPRRFDHRDGDLRIARPRTLDGRLRSGLVFDNVGRPRPTPPAGPPLAPLPPPAAGLVYAPGAWVRDACHPLPPQEVCARLSERRYELDRRYNSALQSERAQITLEQRGIDARLATDCGAY